MQSAERSLLSLLGSVSTGVHFLVAIAVLVLGLVLVKPLHQTAGFVFAGAGGARLVGLGIDLVIDAIQAGSSYDTLMVWNMLGTLVWLGTSAIFYGGVMFGAYRLSEVRTRGGGAWVG